jgi:hypothetical protein
MASSADITESIYDFCISVIPGALAFKYYDIVEKVFSLGFKACIGALVAGSSTMHHFGSLAQLIATAACGIITLTVGAAVCHVAIACLIQMLELIIKYWKAARMCTGWVLRTGSNLSLYAVPVLILSYLWNPLQSRVFWSLLVAYFEYAEVEDGTLQNHQDPAMADLS